MGRAPCCSKVGLRRGPWTAREDTLLTDYVQVHGEGRWRSLPKMAGLLRCGKSCRLRWMNYLRPGIKRGNITPDEDDLIIRLHSLLGNRWSLIAGRLPGRTDNEIKNYWNTHLSKRLNIKVQQHHETITKKRNYYSKNKKEPSETITGTKIHLPKPMRITSFSMTRNYNLDFPSSDLKDSGYNGDGDHHDFFNGSSDPVVATKDDMLEKFYEEYFQLLKTDHEDH